jgi:hypothetical protein
LQQQQPVTDYTHAEAGYAEVPVEPPARVFFPEEYHQHQGQKEITDSICHQAQEDLDGYDQYHPEERCQTIGAFRIFYLQVCWVTLSGFFR